MAKNTVTVSKNDLIAKLKAAKLAQIEKTKQEKDTLRESAIKQATQYQRDLAAFLKNPDANTKSATSIAQHFGWYRREYIYRDNSYDQAIKLLELSTEDTIELSLDKYWNGIRFIDLL